MSARRLSLGLALLVSMVGAACEAIATAMAPPPRELLRLQPILADGSAVPIALHIPTSAIPADQKRNKAEDLSSRQQLADVMHEAFSSAIGPVLIASNVFDIEGFIGAREKKGAFPSFIDAEVLAVADFIEEEAVIRVDCRIFDLGNQDGSDLPPWAGLRLIYADTVSVERGGSRRNAFVDAAIELDQAMKRDRYLQAYLAAIAAKGDGRLDAFRQAPAADQEFILFPLSLNGAGAESASPQADADR